MAELNYHPQAFGQPKAELGFCKTILSIFIKSQSFSQERFSTSFPPLRLNLKLLLFFIAPLKS